MEAESTRNLPCWKDYHVRRRAFFLAPVIWFMTGILATTCDDLIFKQQAFVLPAIFIGLAFCLGVQIWRISYRCPRCDNLFSYRYWARTFNRKCVYCGLPVDADPTTPRE